MTLGLIISPAKKMNVVEGPPYVGAQPQFLERTTELLDALKALSYDEAKALWQCSDRLADLNYRRTQEADLMRDPTAAVISYEGIQYQHMAPQVMDEDCLAYLDRHLRILSGFYGLLRPTDGVIPYRLEMQARLALPATASHPATHNLYEFWGDSLARSLAGEFDTIVNIASVEYAKAVTPHLAARDTRVVTCLFATRRPSDGKVIQRATEAKAARGTFVRWCAEHDISSPAQLSSFNERNYQFEADLSTPNELLFLQG